MYQVYGIKNVLYYHVGSPRVRSEDRWGDVFESFHACQRVCDELAATHGVKFLTIYPREVEQPHEVNFDDNSES